MLTLTETARTIIELIPDDANHADTAGLRISGEGADDGLHVATADAPEPQDHTVEDDGARLFLDPAAAERLEGRELGVEFDHTGTAHFHSRPES